MSAHYKFDFKLDIIVPVRNEAENILNLYQNICKALDRSIDWRATIIYDFPEDTTRQLAEQIQKNDSRVLSKLQTFGPGALNAIKYSVSIVHDQAVLYVMGDCCDDLTLIPQMLHEIQSGAIIVSASRFKKRGDYSGGSLLKKHLTYFAGTVLHLFGLETNDPTNNFKMYSGKWLKSQKIESTGSFEVALELVVKASLTKQKIVELPGSWKERTKGSSKFNFKKALPHYIRWFLYYFKHLLIS